MNLWHEDIKSRTSCCLNINCNITVDENDLVDIASKYIWQNNRICLQRVQHEPLLEYTLFPVVLCVVKHYTVSLSPYRYSSQCIYVILLGVHTSFVILTIAKPPLSTASSFSHSATNYCLCVTPMQTTCHFFLYVRICLNYSFCFV